MNRKSKVIVSIVGITIVLLALLGITYAYYLTRIEGNTNTNSISLTTADLKLVYRDGNGAVTKENIMPGTIIEKTFTVENTGNNKVDNYAVYLEELVNTLSRTEDLTYELVCTSTSGTCNGGSGEFPRLAGMIATNSIDSGVTHTYKLTVTYANLEDVNQSEDMGSVISAFVQIYAMVDILDIEGTVENYSDGDYAQINSVQKRSQIVEGNYKFAGVLPGTHTIKICDKEDETCSTPKLSQQIEVKVGTTAGVSGNTITMTESSQIASINMNVSSGSITIDTEVKEYIPFKEGTLAYAILNNAINPIGETSTVYSPTPLTEPGKEISGENERTLSITEDYYGETYYFRGNVIDNYVNFAGMCFRIVRIEGDGSIKIVYSGDILEGEVDCTSLTDSSGIIHKDEYATYGYKSIIGLNGDSWHVGDYENDGKSLDNPEGNPSNSIKETLDCWFNEKFMLNNSLTQSGNKLKEETWCLGGSYDFKYYDSKLITDEELNKKYQEEEFYYWQYSSGIRFDNKITDLTCVNEDTSISEIGALTVDEVMLAGSKNSNSTYYLYENTKDYTYWTLSRAFFVDADSGEFAFVVNYEGGIDTQYSDSNGGSSIRPVVVLKPGTIITTGVGTKDNPYIIG